MKIVFAGTPKFGADILNGLLCGGHQVVLAVCNGDAAGNRGRLEFSPVKRLALEKGLPLFQCDKLSAEGVEVLKRTGADCMVTAAFSHILSQEVLDLFPYGVINVHGSLLPKYRGAAPVQSGIMAGERAAGVTIMKTVLELDAGDIIAQSVPIDTAGETSGTLMDKLALLAIPLLVNSLTALVNGRAKLIKQNHAEATFTKKLTKQKSVIDFDKNGTEIDCFVRAYDPSPVARTFVTLENGENAALKVYKISVLTGFENSSIINGSIIAASPKEGLIIKCGGGAVSLDTIQGEGGKTMSARDWLRGHRVRVLGE